MVTAQYTGELAYSKSPRTVFEHIEGGGPCDFCPEGRGPMCQTIDTNEFICDPCRSTLRQGSEQLSRRLGVEPSRFLYVPIIETVEYEV
ncbi:hypothetical protein [Streptomyces ardesiacus]|uniref:hypothetical protein n=1 Tax=Streptomyces ardesiacus TaxID=285564 RepID=UPI0038053BB9